MQLTITDQATGCGVKLNIPDEDANLAFDILAVRYFMPAWCNLNYRIGKSTESTETIKSNQIKEPASLCFTKSSSPTSTSASAF